MPFIPPKFDRNQLMMTSFDALIDSNSVARIIDCFIDHVDLKSMGFSNTVPSNDGRPCYPASCYAKLYLYGYRKDIRSSRKLEAACKVNIEVMWLMEGLTPDFRSISDFRKNNSSCLRKLFKEFVKRVTVDIKTGVVSVDGSKFKAWNSKDRNFTILKLDDRIKWLEQHTEEYLRQLEIYDEEELKEGELTQSELEEKLQKTQERLELYKSYREYMEKERLSQISLTDPDCRLMKNKNGMDTSYNIQTAIDSETHLMLDYQTTNQATDHGLMASTTEDIKQNKTGEIINVISDKGYLQEEDMVECLEKGIIPNVILPKGEDTYELKIDYEESEYDPTSTEPDALRKTLHAGDIPEVYKSVIDKVVVKEVRYFVADENEVQLKSPYLTEEEMIARAAEGYFVRDPEADKVYCPTGTVLRRKSIKANGETRYANRTECKKCPYRNQCASARMQWKEIDFSKDTLEKRAKWWNPEDPDDDPKGRGRKAKRKGHYEKKKVVIITFRPNKQLTQLRQRTSEHPFGTIKRWHHSGYFLVKGKQKVDGEFALFGIGYNLSRAEKLFSFEELMARASQKGA